MVVVNHIGRMRLLKPKQTTTQSSVLALFLQFLLLKDQHECMELMHSGDVGVEGSVTDAIQAQARSKNRVPHLVPRLATLLSITAKKRCKVCLWLCYWLCSKDSKLGHP